MEQVFMSIIAVVLLTLFPWWLMSHGSGPNIVLAWYVGLFLGMSLGRL